MAPTQTTNYAPHPMGELPFPLVNGSLMKNNNKTNANTNTNTNSNYMMSETHRESIATGSDTTQKQHSLNYAPHPMGELPFPVLNGPLNKQKGENEEVHTQSTSTQ
jgi:hypothetical protein